MSFSVHVGTAAWTDHAIYPDTIRPAADGVSAHRTNRS